MSYSSADRPIVLRVAEQLEKRGCSCFLDQWYLQPGQDWVAALETALVASRSAAVFIGPYEMGRWQQKERAWVLDRRAEETHFPVVPVLLPGCEPPLGFLKQLMWIDLRDSAAEADLMDALAAAVRGQQVRDSGRKEARNTVCPFRGLLPFREEDASFFFGREKYTRDLVNKVQRHRLVAVVGSSGSGKSSVVRAGLVPRLRLRKEPPVWEIATMVPAETPLKSLVKALAPMLWPDIADAVDLRERVNDKAASLRQGNLSVADLVEIVLDKQSGSQRLLLVVDQWEELEQAEQSFVAAGFAAARKRRLIVWGSISSLACIAAVVYVLAAANHRLQNLLAASPEGFEYTLQHLHVYRPLVTGRLHTAVTSEDLEPLQRRHAALALARFGDLRDDELAFLLEGISAAKPEEARNYVRALEQVTQPIEPRLLQLTEDANSLAAKRRYASLGLSLGLTASAESMATLDADPADRTELIHELWTDWAPDLEKVLDILIANDNDDLCSVLCCALGRYDYTLLTDIERSKVLAVLDTLHRNAHGAGTHSASGWALRKWGQSLPALVSESDDVPPDREWFVAEVDESTITLVWIPPTEGTFTMGSNDNLRGDEPVHEVRLLKGLWLSDREVSVTLFEQFRDDDDYPGPRPSGWKLDEYGRQASPTPGHPVLEVDWHEAAAFCNWLSWKAKIDPSEWCYEVLVQGEDMQPGLESKPVAEWLHRTGYRLPTEAEWEYACRANSGTMFCYGDEDLSRVKWLHAYAVFASGNAEECGAKMPTGWGSFDLHGNVEQWCADWYGDYTTGRQTDVGGPAEGGFRVNRGGSWSRSATDCRSAYRFRDWPGLRNYDLGFRIARSPSGKPGQARAERRR